MVDSGGGGSSTSSRLASTVPTTIFQMLQTAQALGLDLSALAGKLGVKEEGRRRSSGAARLRPQLSAFGHQPSLPATGCGVRQDETSGARDNRIKSVGRNAEP